MLKYMTFSIYFCNKYLNIKFPPHTGGHTPHAHTHPAVMDKLWFSQSTDISKPAVSQADRHRVPFQVRFRVDI